MHHPRATLAPPLHHPRATPRGSRRTWHAAIRAPSLFATPAHDCPASSTPRLVCSQRSAPANAVVVPVVTTGVVVGVVVAVEVRVEVTGVEVSVEVRGGEL